MKAGWAQREQGGKLEFYSAREQRQSMCLYRTRKDAPCICDGGTHAREATQRAINKQYTRMVRALPYLKARAERFRWA